MNIKTLQEKLTALLDTGLTYRAVAELAGCDISTISRIKSGSITNPTYATGSAIDLAYAGLGRKHPKKSAA
jgi:transcriptional regulator with XRE-family HTH domain